MQYLLGTASPTHPVPVKIYEGFKRELGQYRDYSFYYSPGGQLFTHQFSHAWFDFRGIVDGDGINWFENSIQASLASRQFCIDNPEGFQTYHAYSWGLTASEGPNGYAGHGTPPYHKNVTPTSDGTVAPAAALGSIVFTPDESTDVLRYLFHNEPRLWGRYGLKDAYNLDKKPAWYSERVIGIDKGITLLMIENFRSGLVWELYMQNDYVQQGKELLGWKKEAKRND